MKDMEYKLKRLHYESYFNHDGSLCNGVENVNIIVHKKKVKNRKKYERLKSCQQPALAFRLSRFGTNKSRKLLKKHSSMPEITKRLKLIKQRTRSSDAINRKRNRYFNSKLIVNRVSEYHFNDNFNPFNYPNQKKWKVYRCQLSSPEDTCCCSCNSDAMFEVMKGLYDCYKKKNCDNCNCILCSHLPHEERELGEVKKSLASVGLAGGAKERKEKVKKAEKALKGKTKEEKEKILKELAKAGEPLPEGKTASEKALIQKIRTEVGLPPEPKTPSEKAKMRKAEAAGVMTPLEGKTHSQKEKILKAQAQLGIPLPEGRTESEKAIIHKIKTDAGIPEGVTPDKYKKAKEAGYITPLAGKSPEQKEKILRGLAMEGLPLPEGKTASERKLIDKVRADLGLPPEPKTESMREKYAEAANAGLMQPLEGKSPKEKERILQGLVDMGIPLPEGRTESEKKLIAKVRARPGPPGAEVAPSERIRRAKAAGILTPLEGKTPEQKEKILRGLAMQGLPLPEAKTASERKLVEKVRADLGLPPEPKTQAMKDKHVQAAKAGLLQPLEGKSAKEKEKILQGLHDMGIPLPEGRTASEKAIIAKVKAGPHAPSTPSEKIRKAKAEGLLTPLAGKTPEQKEDILRGLAMQGIPLPEAKTASEKKLIQKVRADLGLPPEPKTASMRDKYAKAADAGLLQPLEGKSAKEKEKILQGLHDMGIPLPEGRTASEKAIIAKVKAGPHAPSTPSEKIRKAKAAGLLTPLTDKSPAQREKILRGLAMQGVPLPEAKTPSEKMLIDKVRADLGLPPEPKTPSMKGRHTKAADAGFLQPLEGKSPKEKERILQGLHDLGIPLPEGRTASEKALIAKVKGGARAPSITSEKLRKAKAAGLLTPLEGKTPAQKEKIIKGLAMQGLPLPEGKTASERKLIQKVRADLGLPPEPKTPSMKEKYAKAANAGLMQPLEGKSAKEKEKILQGLQDMGIPLPEGRTASEKALIAKIKAKPHEPSLHVPSEKIRKAQAAGLLTPLEGKTPAQQEKILRGLAMQGMPLPEGKTASQRRLADKVRADLGLPPAPKTAADREKYNKAVEAGLIVPLEGKSADEKEKILRGQHELGLPLPEGRTASEKSLIRKIKGGERKKTKAVGFGQPALPPEQRRKLDEKTAKVVKEGKGPADECICGLLTPDSEKEPISAAKKPTEIAKTKAGTAPSITTEKLRKAKAAGLLTPLEGKTPEQKEKILRGLAKSGLPLPEGKTASEKALIKKVKADFKIPERTQSEKIRRAKTAGLLTPLEGKTKSQKEKILRGRAAAGLPLPVGKTASERALIQKIKDDTGYVTPSPSERLKRAKAAGLLTPLEGKTPAEKEKIMRERIALGLPIAEGKTPSEKEILKKITAGEPPAAKRPSERERQAKAAGLLTPLEGKTPQQKEKILRGLVKAGIPLPEPKSASERDLMNKIRNEVGLPPEPKTPSLKEKYKKAQAAGIIVPLEGKTPAEKEKILRKLHDAGIPLPEGRTPSEKSMIKRIKAGLPERKIPSEKLKAAKAAGLLTPLEGKTSAQKEKIIKDLAKAGLPLPEPKTASEREIMKKVRTELGLPPEAATASIKEKMEKAQAAGKITPLEGKTHSEKEKILKDLAEAGVPLPEGRTATEKAIISKLKAESKAKPVTPEKLAKAKEAGLLTPLAGKSAKDKERIMRGLVKQGLPLPEPQTASERKIAEKIRKDLALPPEPKNSAERMKMRKAQAAGIITPLEGKTAAEKEKILRNWADAGIPLPEGRTASEKALIKKIKAKEGKAPAKGKGAPALPPAERAKLDKRTAKVMKEGKGPSDECICGLLTPESERKEVPTKLPSDKLKKAKAAGLITPLEGKTKAEKEKILRGLAKEGIPLPEGKTPSEKKLIQKIRKELGLPPEPTTASMRGKHEKAAAAGVLVPLEGLSPAEKERVLREQANLGLPLPEGRTASEKALIAKVKAETKGAPPKTPSEKLRHAKAAGLLTPLEGKTNAQKEKILKGLAKEGIPLPEGKTPSEKKLIQKIRKELGLPPEPTTASMRGKHEKAAAAGVLVPLEGLSPAEKERVLREQANLGLPLPEGRTASEKALIAKVKAESKGAPTKIPSEKLQHAKAAGLLTPLEGKSKAQKEKILRGLAKEGIPLPEGKTPSEKKLIQKIRKELGLPPEPTTASMRGKHEKAAAAGVLVPLEGLSPAEKERVLREQANLGLPLPEGRTASEKALIAKVKAESKGAPPKIPSEKLRHAKAAGLLTPLEGKTNAQKEKILKGLAKEGIPLPEGKTPSEKKLIQKIRKELGLPPEPTTASMRGKHEKAAAAGVLVPLEGLSPAEKERVLREQANLGLPLPEGRTASEKALIAKVKAESKGAPPKTQSEKLRHAKAAGLLTPLEGKTNAQKEKILKGLAKEGIPLPEGKTPSEKKLIQKIRKELGLPPEPTTASMRGKHEKAAAAGVLVPLEGLSPAEKERVLREQANLGLPLPEGRTASEKALIAKVKAESKGPPTKIPSEKLQHAKAAGLLTPLEGKSKAQKEKILRGLAKEGIPLPEGKTPSEKKLIQKIRKELGLPPEPTTASMRGKHEKAAAAGVLVPLEGLSPAEKERVLREQANLGLPLPEGRTASEKALIAKVKAETKGAPPKTPSEQLRHAKAAGLLTPLEGKSKAQKEKILKGLAKEGIPLPEGKTPSEKKLIQKIRKELGLPPEPTTASMRGKHEKAAAAGVLVPLEGLSPAEKERVLREQANLGLPLPEGRTASEKALIAKVKAETKGAPPKTPSEQLRHAKAAGLLTPLEGKSKAQKEKILKGLAKEGIPLPEGKTPSEKKLIQKIRKELGLPPEPTTASMRGKHEKAAAAGVLVPLEGLSPAEKEKVLRGQANLGIPLPEGRTASEKALIAKIKAEQEPTKVPSEKLRQAKAAGLLTPLEGKTKAQKEKIIRSLAEAGLPLPEGKTASEKALIQKVRTELGIPPPAKTASEKAIVGKAKAEGLLTPLAGKSTKEKERIVKGLIDAGLPVPEGKTASEKDLIKKIRTAAGLPPEKTPSERKVEIRKKSKKIGVSPSKKIAKSTAAKYGIAEEFEDVIKTTTCDRGCGCDKKKIRFKHSYVKIRVTSPDISSLCPCPDECIPGVKAGAFIDNEGIKVTVGRVDGVTSYTSQFSNHILESPENIVTLFDKRVSNSFSSNSSIDTVDTLFENVATNDRNNNVCPSNRPINNDDKTIYDLTSSFSSTSGCNDSGTSLKTYDIASDRGYLYEIITPCEQWADESDRYLDTSKYLQSSEDICRNPASISCTSVESSVMEESSRSSFDSILVIKSESSLSLSTKSSCSMDVNSVISLSNSSCITDSFHYSYYPVSNVSNSTVETSECFTNRIDYTDIDCIGIDTVTSGSNNHVDGASCEMRTRNREDRTVFSRRNKNAYLTYRLSHTDIGDINNMNRINTRKTNNGEPIIVINNLDSDHDITTMVDLLLSNNEFSNTSSIFLVVPTSDDNDSDTSSGSLSSTICIQLSEHHPNWRNRQHNFGISEAVASSRRNTSTTRGLKISSRGKQFFMEGMQGTSSSMQKESLLYKMSKVCRHRDDKKSKNKLCQISTPKEVIKQLPHGVSTDTTDRPCCCAPNRVDETHHKHGSDHRCVANVVSELITPLLVNQGLNCDTLCLPKRNVNQQASFMSINRDTRVTTCRIPPCAGQTSCHPSDMNQKPFGASMPEPVPDLGQPTPDTSQSQRCQCNPEKLRMLLEEAVKAGQSLNKKSVGCGGEDTKPEPAPILKAPIPTTSTAEDCGTCPKPVEHEDGLKLQCSCSGKKRTVKLRSLCPCERYQPTVSKAVPGPKAGTRSMGCQCCACKDSKLGSSDRKGKQGAMEPKEMLGPEGGLVIPEPGGTYTQAGMRPSATTTSPESSKKTCVCHGKNGKRNKNVICECPPEPEEPPPAPEPLYVPVTLSYEEYKQNMLEETRQVMRMRSDMTQTLSGFKMLKKKKPPPPPEVEFTIEDAIRYYATMNPDIIKDLVPPPQEFRETTNRDYEDCICDEKKRKKSKKDVECECPYEPPPPPPPPPPEPEPVPEPEEPFRGLKFQIGGKGSGSKGLSGVCCFGMYQETSRSTSRRSD